MILVGAKQDLAAEKREVTEEQAKTFASHYPDEIVDVVETSAKVCAIYINFVLVYTAISLCILPQQHVNITYSVVATINAIGPFVGYNSMTRIILSRNKSDQSNSSFL